MFALQGSAEASKGQFFMQWGLSSTFDSIGSQVFIQKSVRELLFEGYEDTLLALADWFGQESKIPLDRFGWFYKVGCVILDDFQPFV